MRKILIGSGLLAACVAASANAGFAGFGANSYAVNVGGVDYAVVDVYATYSSTSDKFLSILNSNISLVGASNFYQKANGDGVTGWMNNNLDAADSKVTAGALLTGNTSADPSFLNFTDEEGADTTLPPSPNAGWYASNPAPANNSNGAKLIVKNGWIGAAGDTLGVFIGRFSVAGIGDGSRALIFSSTTATGVVGGSGTTFSTDSKSFKYVPTPGALALLGIAGLAGRRRRA